MSPVPKAVLYHAPPSIWSAVVLLTLHEKGYADDELDQREVDLSKGENFDPSFLRLNPKATVPTLVVPLQKTLTDDVESRYKAITETKAIVEFLDASRSAISRTHTTSTAPAPALAPATIALTATTNTIIDDILHSEAANPNNLRYLNAHDDTSLQILAGQVLPALTGKENALAQYISDAENETIHVSEKVKNLWREKRAAVRVLLEVLRDAHKPADSLDEDGKIQRDEFFRVAREAWGVDLKAVLQRLNKEIAGPYALGDQFSIVDLHLAGWTARLIKLVGGVAEDNGISAIGKLESRVGLTLPRDFRGADAQHGEAAHQNKLSAFWDAVKERPSWKKVYGDGLY